MDHIKGKIDNHVALELKMGINDTKFYNWCFLVKIVDKINRKQKIKMLVCRVEWDREAMMLDGENGKDINIIKCIWESWKLIILMHWELKMAKDLTLQESFVRMTLGANREKVKVEANGNKILDYMLIVPLYLMVWFGSINVFLLIC